MRFWRSNRWLTDLDQDIRDHIEEETRENIDRGMAPDEARLAALRKFGNTMRVQEDTRAVWSAVWLEQLLQDLRYGARMLRSHPGFTVVAVATLALGIGMNTAVFSVVNAVLLKPLPYPGADRLYWIGNYVTSIQRDIHVTRPNYLLWKVQARLFEKMAAYGNDDLAMVSGGLATEERIASVAGDFWTITGAQAAFGRLFQAGELNGIVLTWPLFERRFGSDPHVLGTTITVDGYPFTIAGVLKRDFHFGFPQQFAKGDEIRDIDAFLPIPDALMNLPSPFPAVRWFEALRRYGPAPYSLFVIGRLKADVPADRARTEMEALYQRSFHEYPQLERDQILHFAPLQDKLTGDSRRALLVLLIAVGFVLLIACTNVANLLVARAAARQREIAVRTAMGAGRTRVIRQFLAESVLLALLGCAAGLFLAHQALSFILRIAPEAAPRLAETAIDTRVLWFSLALSLVTGFFFGLAPAVSQWRSEVYEVLKAETGTASAAGARTRLRGLLAAAQLALAIILLAGAGLMLKSFWRMNARPAGFSPENILVMRITLSGPQYSSWPPKQAYTEQLLQTLESLPGVEAAGIDAGSLNTSVKVGGAGTDSPGDLFASIRGVSAGYLRAIGVPLIRGSWPARGSLFGVAVNEAFARQMVGRDPVGRHIGGSILNDTITGVVTDFKTWQLDAEPMPEVYLPYERLPISRSMRVVVRATGPAAPLAPAVRKLISGIDSTQPIYEFQTLEAALSSSIAPRRFNLFLLSAFAVSALVLAMIGIYGVMAYSVVQRTREIGIRLALGARRGEIVSMVVGQGMLLALGGIGAGIMAALALTRLMASLLYDVKPNDPWIFTLVTAALAATALIAAAVPALRAARVDPLIALRYE